MYILIVGEGASDDVVMAVRAFKRRLQRWCAPPDAPSMSGLDIDEPRPDLVEMVVTYTGERDADAVSGPTFLYGSLLPRETPAPTHRTVADAGLSYVERWRQSG
jgi:hypothetical protein